MLRSNMPLQRGKSQEKKPGPDSMLVGMTIS